MNDDDDDDDEWMWGGGGGNCGFKMHIHIWVDLVVFCPWSFCKFQ